MNYVIQLAVQLCPFEVDDTKPFVHSLFTQAEGRQLREGPLCKESSSPQEETKVYKKIKN